MRSLKEDLFKWTCKKHAMNCCLNKYLLRRKALALAKMRGLNDFKSSNTWMSCFLKEHGFSCDLSNRAGPVFDNYRDWIDLMRSTIIMYKHNELFHVDELVMYADLPPTKILGDEIESDEGNRITVLTCCNSSGTTKLPLLICGPYPSKITTEDHVYCHSEQSLIDDGLLKNWLVDVNDRMSRCDQKILLFLQRKRAHALRDFPLSNVSLVYLPEDFPQHLRPLRRDVFHYVKMIFRRRYAERLGEKTVDWNLRDILESLIDAWEAVPREIIICRFQRTYFRTDESFIQIDCDCWEHLKTGIAFKKFVTFDDHLSDKAFYVDDCRDRLTPSCSRNQMPTNSNRQRRDLVARRSSQRLSVKRAYSEIQFALNSDGSKSGDENIKDRDVGPSRSISRKRRRQRLTKSFQQALNKTFALTTSAKLIGSIYASKRETKKDVDCQTEFRNSSEEENAKVPSNLNETVSCEANQLSTSRMDCDNLQENSKVLGKEPEKSKLDNSMGDSNDNEPSEKKLKIDYSWSKQFETAFVFGPPNALEGTSRTLQCQRDENTVHLSSNIAPSVSPTE